MILFNTELNESNINIKTKLKYSNDFEFIPIKYNNNELLIQTPPLYTNGIKSNYDKNAWERLYGDSWHTDVDNPTQKRLDKILKKY